MNEKDFQLKLIQRYIENKCTDEELEIFFHLIETDQINDVLSQKMNLLMDAEDAVTSPVIPKVKKEFYPFRSILKVVATITVIIAAGTYAFHKRTALRDWIDPVKYVVFETKKGEIKKIELTDGSIITLNAHSGIRYPEKFNRDIREVDLLDGEAFFDVHHDKSKPFVVKSGSLKTQVLGTAFNIRFYSYLKTIDIAVTKGKIAVENTVAGTGKTRSFLLPGDKLSLNKQSGRLLQSKFTLTDAIAWTSGKLIFDNESLANVASVLTDRYNVNIEFAHKKIKNYHFTASFETKDSLTDILKVLCLANKLFYTITDNKVILTLKHL